MWWFFLPWKQKHILRPANQGASSDRMVRAACRAARACIRKEVTLLSNMCCLDPNASSLIGKGTASKKKMQADGYYCYLFLYDHMISMCVLFSVVF